MRIIIMLFVVVSFCSSEIDLIINANIKLIHLKDSIFIHETMFDFPGFGRYPSNGLLFVKNGKALLVDTPANNEMTQTLLTYVADSLGATVNKAVLCHSHVDCMGGIETLHDAKIETIALDKTVEICKGDSLPLPKVAFTDSLKLSFEKEKIGIFYFGGGHTVDNIVVAFEEQNLIFGGCLIKSRYSGSLGNVKEADVAQWDQTIMTLQKRFPSVEIIVPGHGAHGDKELLSHTIELVEKHREKVK